jgi:transposase
VRKIRKTGGLSDFERGQIVRAHLAGATMIKTATLLGVSRATVSEVMSAYTDHGKTTSARGNSGRSSTLTESGRRTLRGTVSKNHRTTAAQVTGQQN